MPGQSYEIGDEDMKRLSERAKELHITTLVYQFLLGQVSLERAISEIYFDSIERPITSKKSKMQDSETMGE